MKEPLTACAACGYDLQGISGDICPECGVACAAARAAATRRGSRRHRIISIGIAIAIWHGPQSWVLWIHYPWGEYRRTVLALWPILLGYLPQALFFSMLNWRGERLGFVMAAIITCGMVGFTAWLIHVGRWWCIAMTILLLPISIFFAVGMYHAFLM